MYCVVLSCACYVVMCCHCCVVACRAALPRRAARVCSVMGCALMCCGLLCHAVQCRALPCALCCDALCYSALYTAAHPLACPHTPHIVQKAVCPPLSSLCYAGSCVCVGVFGFRFLCICVHTDHTFCVFLCASRSLALCVCVQSDHTVCVFVHPDHTVCVFVCNQITWYELPAFMVFHAVNACEDPATGHVKASDKEFVGWERGFYNWHVSVFQ